MKGSEMLMKRVIEALPEEIKAGLTEAITVLPTFAKTAQQTFQTIDQRLERLERMERYNIALSIAICNHFKIQVPATISAPVAAINGVNRA